MFISGLEKYGKRWAKIAALVKTRTLTQIRTHAQKYYLKLSKAKHNVSSSTSSSERDGDKESDNNSQEQDVGYRQTVQLLEEEYDDYEEEEEEEVEEGEEDSEDFNAAQSLIDLRSVYDNKSDVPSTTSTIIQRQDGATYYGSSVKKKVREY